MALTATAVNNAKAKDKAYKLTDSDGLYLQVSIKGSKLWRYNYRLNGKQGTYSIGSYPDISLKKARELHREARGFVAQGKKPIQIKEAIKVKSELDEKRFSFYAKQWFDKQNLAESTAGDMWQRIEKNLISPLDKKRVNEFTTADLMKVMLEISNRGAKETAIRLSSVVRRVYNEILILGIVETNPAQGLAELLPKPDHKLKKNFAHILNVDEIRNLLLQIDKPSARQDFSSTQALRLMPLVFLRPHNIRFMRWEYISFESSTITFPDSEMKSNKELIVPLARQALQILRECQQLTGDDEFVFSSTRANGKPMSENTLTMIIKRFIRLNGEPYGTGFMTSHGFRHMASTHLNELGYDSDIIELQLAHINKDRIRATYNKAQLIDKRIDMMQSWADYLDGLKSNNNVISINRKAS